MALNSDIFRNKFFMFGVPFLLLVVGGSFGLEEFAKIRYKYKKNRWFTPEVLKEYGIEIKNPGEVTLESEYEKIKDLANQEWENKRGPRPWEPETMKN